MERKVEKEGSVLSRDMAQGLGRPGFAAIALPLNWERPFLGRLYAWSSAIQGKPVESGGRLQRPDVGVEGGILFSIYTDAKAENGRAYIGSFLEISQPAGPWFSLEVAKDWASWAFVKGIQRRSLQPWGCSIHRWVQSGGYPRGADIVPQGEPSVATPIIYPMSRCFGSS